MQELEAWGSACAEEGTAPDQVLDPEATRRSRGPVPAELAPLLRYLGVGVDAFAANETRYFAALGALLRAAGAIHPAAPLDRATYRQAVLAFQRARGLDEDGVPGADVCWALQRTGDARALSIRSMPADRAAGSGGYDRTSVRSDAAAAYGSVLAEVRAAGGIVTSAGAFRALGAPVGAGRSRTSMHYSGLALDLATDTGMRDPRRDPYVVVPDGRKWRVFARSPAAPVLRLDAVVWRRGAADVQQVEVEAFDLTAVFERHGFARIGPRAGFPGDYLCAEWWHFQYESPLVPWVSQFGIELLALESAGGVVYDEPHLRAYDDVWASRKRLYQRLEEGWW